MKQIPKIEKFMTPMPHSIGKDIQVKVGLEMMRDHGIRHLVVQDGGKLVGILTDRDIKLAASFSGSDDLTVEEVMTPDPYTVQPEAPLDQVVSEMAEHKYGAAIVQQANHKVVGIFTAIDGLRAFAEILNQRFKS